MYKLFRLISAVLLWLAVPSGCVVSSEQATVDFSALEKQFSIDATAWSVNVNSARELFQQTCQIEDSVDPCVSTAALLGACKGNDCVGACNERISRCGLALPVELWRAVSLLTEIPSLKSFASPAETSNLEITLEEVSYEVSLNTLNIDTAELTLYVAPATVMIPVGRNVQAIATIPAIPAFTDVGTRRVEFLPDGKDILKRQMSDYQVPFNLIVGSALALDTEDAPVPTGRLNLSVRVKGYAGF